MIGLTSVRYAILLVLAGQLPKFRLTKLKTLVALLLTVCICGDYDMVLSISIHQDTYEVSLHEDYNLLKCTRTV